MIRIVNEKWYQILNDTEVVDDFGNVVSLPIKNHYLTEKEIEKHFSPRKIPLPNNFSIRDGAYVSAHYFNFSS